MATGWVSVSGAAPLLALQRTGNQHWIGQLPMWDRSRLRGFYNRRLLPSIERHHRRLFDDYAAGMRLDAAEILASVAPPDRPVVLDIGGGLGGLGIALQEHLSYLDYWLLDREGSDSDVWFGMAERGAKYHSFDVARRFCAANGLSAITTVDIDSEPFPDRDFDLIISLLSWGFHYPVGTYAEQATAHLAAGGAIVLDVRHGPEAGALAEAFDAWHVETIRDERSYERILLKRSRSATG